MDCQNTVKVKPEYDQLFYDHFNQLLWYRDSSFLHDINNPNTVARKNFTLPRQRSFWRLKNLKTNKLIEANFDAPVIFYEDSIALFTNNGYLGFIDKEGSIILWPEYDACIEVIKNQSYLLTKKNEYVTWSVNGKPTKQPYTSYCKTKYNNNDFCIC